VCRGFWVSFPVVHHDRALFDMKWQKSNTHVEFSCVAERVEGVQVADLLFISYFCHGGAIPRWRSQLAVVTAVCRRWNGQLIMGH